jgi:hypothetical protein
MTEGETGIEVWSSPPWRARAVAWLDEQLAASGLARTGEVEQRVRPWATVLRAPTTAGVVWLKAPGPGTRAEVRLYEVLRRVVPARVLIPLAIDATRGWLLLPDGGTALARQADEAAVIAALAAALPQYGQLQRDLAPHLGELLAAGVPDMRPAIMPRRFDEALAAIDLEATARERLRAFRPTFEGWCERLASAPGTASLDHNDLHAGNVFVDAAGGARFYDWGDSVVAHPFASLLVALGPLRRPGDDRDVLRLRDAYLEAFTDLAPRPALVETVELACQVAKVARALTWHRALVQLPPHDHGVYAGAAQACLDALLAGGYLGAP